jgi:DNA-3-methyladenine glycosylase II
MGKEKKTEHIAATATPRSTPNLWAPEAQAEQVPEPWAKAVRHLRRVDPWLRQVIKRVGPCQLSPRPDRFGTLVNSIIAQQISSKAAAAINHRLHALGGQPHQPERLLALGEVDLRSVGLSAGKARYVLNLADAVSSGSVPLDAFDETWDDAAITASLTSIKGIGIWTAEMFLIFSLNRPDVLPASDLGVRAALQGRHSLSDLPRPKECHALAEPWRPYRTIASWYIWQNIDSKLLAKTENFHAKTQREDAKAQRKSPRI